MSTADHDRITRVETRVDRVEEDMRDVKETQSNHGKRILGLETRVGLGAFFGTAVGAALARLIMGS